MIIYLNPPLIPGLCVEQMTEMLRISLNTKTVEFSPIYQIVDNNFMGSAEFRGPKFKAFNVKTLTIVR